MGVTIRADQRGEIDAVPADVPGKVADDGELATTLRLAAEAGARTPPPRARRLA
jgi:hypothetical protein